MKILTINMLYKQLSLLWLAAVPCAGLGLHLDSVQKRHPDQLAQGPTFIGNNIVHPTAKIGSDCQIGPDVSIGLECVIGDGVRISNSVLLHRVKVSHIWCSTPHTLDCIRMQAEGSTCETSACDLPCMVTYINHPASQSMRH